MSDQKSAALIQQLFGDVPSSATDAVLSADHPSPEAGGPCATCAFRQGTQANQTAHTLTLARLCVEGITPFQCHEQPRLCRGFIAALNLRGTPANEDERRWVAAHRYAADLLAECIASAVEADSLGAAQRSERKSA
jgi:hypothetical protein